MRNLAAKFNRYKGGVHRKDCAKQRNRANRRAFKLLVVKGLEGA